MTIQYMVKVEGEGIIYISLTLDTNIEDYLREAFPGKSFEVIDDFIKN